MNNLGKMENLIRKLSEDGYTPHYNEDNKTVAWYKINDGTLHYIPITTHIVDEVIEYMDEPYNDSDIIYTFEIRVSKENDMWMIDWDEEEDGHTIYCKGWIFSAIEMLFGHWQNDYNTFGTPEDVWTHEDYFKDVFKEVEDLF